MDKFPHGEFSVFQFFDSGVYEDVCAFVDAETSMKTAVQLIQSVGGRIGTTQKVIITDGDEFICFEWQFGKGIVFPLPDDATATAGLGVAPRG